LDGEIEVVGDWEHGIRRRRRQRRCGNWTSTAPARGNSGRNSCSELLATHALGLDFGRCTRRRSFLSFVVALVVEVALELDESPRDGDSLWL
jgi:hypothetical protein